MTRRSAVSIRCFSIFSVFQRAKVRKPPKAIPIVMMNRTIVGAASSRTSTDQAWLKSNRCLLVGGLPFPRPLVLAGYSTKGASELRDRCRRYRQRLPDLPHLNREQSLEMAALWVGNGAAGTPCCGSVFEGMAFRLRIRGAVTGSDPHCNAEGPVSTCAVTRRRVPVGARPTRRFAPAGSKSEQSWR